MTNDYSALLERVAAIVREAAGITAAPFTVSDKDAPANIVTSADVAVQNFLKEKLCALLPGSVFFGEEGDVQEEDGDCLWIVDPIDGTTNFARGIHEYAISAALVVDEAPVLGVVYNPALDRLYTAVKGCGAFCNGKPIRVSSVPFDRGLLCTAFSLYKKEYTQACIDIVSEAYTQCADFRRFGTCALELCYLAEGCCDLYFEFRLFPWDFAAAGLILTEAGGVVTDHLGRPAALDRTTPLIAANSKANHEKLLSIAAKHIPEIPYTEILR